MKTSRTLKNGIATSYNEISKVRRKEALCDGHTPSGSIKILRAYSEGKTKIVPFEI